MQSHLADGDPAVQRRPVAAAWESVVNELPGMPVGRGAIRFAALWFGIPLLVVFALQRLDAPELLSRWIAHVGF